MGFSTLIDSRDQTRHTRTPQYASVIYVGDVHCSQQIRAFFAANANMPICHSICASCACTKQISIPSDRTTEPSYRTRPPAELRA